jgi:alkaline phosphatase
MNRFQTLLSISACAATAWAARRKFSKGGGAGGRGAETVDDADAEEEAAAAAAEEAGVDMGLVERVRCTHEFCGVCGAPWWGGAG